MLVYLQVLPAIPEVLGGAGEGLGRLWREKFGQPSLLIWIYCNPLKSHKTAKAFFGKAWHRTTLLWKSWQIAWSGVPVVAAGSAGEALPQQVEQRARRLDLAALRAVGAG